MVPEAGILRIEGRWALGATLVLAEGALAAQFPKNAKRLNCVAEASYVQIKMDAGTRNRRSQYLEVQI